MTTHDLDEAEKIADRILVLIDTRWAAVRAGLSRGWIETRQNLTETAYASTSRSKSCSP